MANTVDREGRRETEIRDYDTSALPSGSSFSYMIVRPENGGILDLIKFLIVGEKAKPSGTRFVDSSSSTVLDDGDLTPDHRWVIFVSIIVRKIIGFLGKSMEWTGFCVDFFLNLLSLNGGIAGLFYNAFNGKLIIPERYTETFISTIGHLDSRIDLYKDNQLIAQAIGDSDGFRKKIMIKAETGDRALMDLCIMASKLAYENAQVVRSTIINHWKMHFVDFYNGWNDFEKERSTQVFILCDKPKDATLILISFRGTEPFDADDWITDFDYSWYEIPKLGKVHMGFLEALGLGNRADAATFQYHLQTKKKRNLASSNINNFPTTSLEEQHREHSSDSNKPACLPEELKITAYYAVREKLKILLQEHKNAKFIVTGHSLGGALAILFPTILLLHEEEEMMHRLLGVYTFGQPRVGNRQLGRFMERHLSHPFPKYFRIVYCNDLVPRLPYDNRTFLFKHFGVCLYYNSLYREQRVDEEPNRNYFGIRYLLPEYINAYWELIRALTMHYTYGPEYEEGWFSVLLRVVGLAFPGISAHSPTDYVNSVRLGKEQTVQMS